MKKIIFAFIVLSFYARAEDNLKINDCNKIEICQNKDTMIAYSCLYHEMRDKVQYDNTSCKKLITKIGEQSFVPMIRTCTIEAYARCHNKRDVDLYICLNKIKGDLNSRCRKKVEYAHEKFSELVTEHFPENNSSLEKDDISQKKSGR